MLSRAVSNRLVSHILGYFRVIWGHAAAWIKAGRITKDEFYSWSGRAREKRDECDAGKFTLEEFEVWLKQL